MKMYKHRLGRWDVRKYKKKDKVSAGFDKESCTTIQIEGGELTIIASTAEGKEFNSGNSSIKVTGARGRRGILTVAQKSRMSTRWLSTPDVFRMPEEVIQLSQQLGSGLIDKGLWISNDNLDNPESNRWWGRTILVSQFFEMGNYKQAFDTLNMSFDTFTVLLNDPDPGLLQGAYLVVLQLEPEIGQRFLSFAAEMAAIKLPPKHPLRILLRKLRDAGIMQLRQYAHRILETYLYRLERQLGSSNAGVLLLYENLYDTLDFLSHEKGMNFVNSRTIQERQQSQIQRLEASGLIAEAQSARLALAFTYHRHGLWEEGEQANDNVLEWLQTHPREQHSKKLDLWDSHYLRFQLKMSAGTVEDVTRVGMEYIKVIREEVGPQNKRTIAAINRLQQYYTENGYTKEAEALERDMPAVSEES